MISFKKVLAGKHSALDLLQASSSSPLTLETEGQCASYFHDVLNQHLQMELLLCTCRMILVEHCRWLTSPLYGQQQLLATTQECDISLTLPSLSHLVVHAVSVSLLLVSLNINLHSLNVAERHFAANMICQ